MNIIKVSSLWVAKMTLRRVERVRAPPRNAHIEVPLVFPQPWDTKNKCLLEPGSSPAPSYLLEPDEGNGVDGRAADFIIKFREKNRPDSSVLRSVVSKCIPPPPRSIMFISIIFPPNIITYVGSVVTCFLPALYGICVQ